MPEARRGDGIDAGKSQEKYSIGVNAEDGSRTDDGYLLSCHWRPLTFKRIRYCDTIGGDSAGRIRERFAKLASAVGIR